MGKSPVVNEFLELVLSGVALLWSVVTDSFLCYSTSGKCFLQVLVNTNGSVLVKHFYFKVL